MHTTVAAVFEEIRNANASAWGEHTWVVDLLMQAIELQQQQIEALQAEGRASNKVLNELSPDYVEP